MSSAPLRVRVLGGLVVEGIADRDLASRKGRLLLKVLLLARGRPVSPAQLADAVWGDEQPVRPGEQVGVLVSRLRGVLGAERLPRSDGGYAFLPDWLDLDELDSRVQESRQALAEGRLGAAFAAAEAGLELARGPVLPDDEGEWVEGSRAAAAVLVATARRVGAEAASRVGDHAAAAVRAQEALIDDPFDEVSLRILMRAHGATGRPASALAAYAAFRTRLVDSLGVSPGPDMEALHLALLDATDDPSPDSYFAPHDAPPAGRAGAARVLDGAFERCSATAGGACSVVVSGEAGIGKTTLVEHWARTVSSRAFVLVGRCDPLGRDLPLQPVVDTIAEQLAGSVPPAERARVLEGDASGVAALLGVADPAAAAAATVIADAELGRARLFAGLATVVHRLAAGRPVVLVVDDLHLAGASTVAWLAFAVRRVPHLLVVATGLPGAERLLPDATVLTLDPLGVDALATMVGAERSVDLHHRSGGNPLLARALMLGDDEPLPITLGEAVERRLRGLDDEQVGTLRTAAILGSGVDLDLLAEVNRSTATTMLDHLEAAAGRGLLVERGPGFSFRHELERSALAMSAGTARQALVHREAARALARRPDADPLIVAVHARLGGDTALALEWYVTAAEQATARFDLEAAEGHLDAGLALARSPAAHVARARLYMAALRFDDAMRETERAVEVGGGAGALEAAGWAAYYRRDYGAARAFADEGVRRADDAAVRVSCLALGGRVRHGAGDLAAASLQLERAVAEEAPPEVRGLSSVWLALARLHQGRADEAVVLLQRAMVDQDRLAHPFAGLHARFGRVLAFGYLGRVPEALAAVDDMDHVLERAGPAGHGLRGPAINGHAWILRWCGAGGEADDLNTSAIELTEPTGPRAEAYYAGLLDLADGRMLAGDIDGAAAMLDRLASIEQWDGTMAWHQRHRWLLLRARLARADGRAAEAAGLAALLVSDAGARGALRYELLGTAMGAVAGGGPALDPSALDRVVKGLRTCAALDGWPLVHALGRQFDVPAWRAQAEESASAIVRTAPSTRAAQAFVERQLA